MNLKPRHTEAWPWRVRIYPCTDGREARYTILAVRWYFSALSASGAVAESVFIRWITTVNILYIKSI